MSAIDWVVLASSLVFIVVYGVLRGGKNEDVSSYLLAGREMRWRSITLSIMATQASAITFLSTPGQAYADGMRFVQFYLGLPLAMILLAIFAAPAYHRLRLFTAYEFLETRFDLKTRALTSFLFLVQRGLAAGLTIYAPSLILSVILGWDIHITTAIMGGMVIVYTTTGGARAVNRTQNQQVLIILLGMAAAAVVIVRALPPGVSFLDALQVAGKAGRLNAIDTSVDLTSRYTLWSGLIGGMFLALSYFGTDQSQVQRYLTARSAAESRLGLLANGMLKVPMQFGILLIGAMVFAYFHFVPPPVFFNPVEVARVRQSPAGDRFAQVERDYEEAVEERARASTEMIDAMRGGRQEDIAEAERFFRKTSARAAQVRAEAVEIIGKSDPSANPVDTNYVFLNFVVNHLPAGIVGLVLAAVFAAAMSSTSAELNALASCTVVDVYRRLFRRDAPEGRALLVSRLSTAFWGVFAVGFAEYAGRLGSLVEAVNVLGSLFYGTILGIFVSAFFVRRASGTSTCLAALAAEAAVLACFFFTGISFLWYNVFGCAIVVSLSWALSRRSPSSAAQ
ncbi:MAG: sodium:solute symporter [Acidobacteriota bacterium]